MRATARANSHCGSNSRGIGRGRWIRNPGPPHASVASTQILNNQGCKRANRMNSVPEKVLVVAEEASQRYHLRRTLNASGFDLGEASDGVHALMRLRMI